MPLDKVNTMKRVTTDKLHLTILFIVVTLSKVFGQSDVSGKYTWTDYPGSYITLNADKSFKFRFRTHAQWDLGCGQYKIKGDTITFDYYTDMFDSDCNSERINFADTSGVILQDAIDKSKRPIIARQLRNKLLTIKVGDIGEPKSVESVIYYYKREKNKKRKG